MEDIRFDQIIQIFRTHRRLFLQSFLTILAGAFIVLLFTEVAYPVKASLILQEEDASQMNISPVTMLLGKQSQQILNEIEIVKSRELVDSVIGELNLFFEISRRRNLMFNYILNLLMGKPTMEGSLIIRKYPPAMTLSDSVLEATETGFSLRTDDIVSNCLFNENCSHAGGVVLVERIGDISPGTVYDISYRDLIKTREDLLENILAEPIGDNKESNIFQLLFESPDPHLSVKVLSTLIAQYMNLKISWKKSDADEQQKYITKIIGDIKIELDQKSAALAAYQKENRTVLPDLQFMEIMKRSVEMEKDLAILHLKEDIVRKFIASIRTDESFPIPAPPIIDDIAVQAALQVHNTLVAQEKTFSTTLSDNHPDMIKLRENIRKAKEDLLQLLAKTNETYHNSALILEQQSASTSDIIKNLPNNLRNIASLQRDVEITEKLYAFLMQKYYEAGITASMDNVPVRILDHPTALIKKSRPQLSSFLALSVFVAMVLATFLIFIREWFRTRALAPHEIKDLLSIPTITALSYAANTSLRGEPVTSLARSIFFSSAPTDRVIGLLSFIDQAAMEIFAEDFAAHIGTTRDRKLLVVFSATQGAHALDPALLAQDDLDLIAFIHKTKDPAVSRLTIDTTLSPITQLSEWHILKKTLARLLDRFQFVLPVFHEPPENGLSPRAEALLNKVVIVTRIGESTFSQLMPYRASIDRSTDRAKYSLYILE